MTYDAARVSLGKGILFLRSSPASLTYSFAFCCLGGRSRLAPEEDIPEALDD